MNWRDYALCAGTAQPRKDNGDAVDWFYDTYEKDPVVREQIRELCDACPVRVACKYQGETGKEYGVWGGVYLENGVPAEGKFE